MRSAGLNGDGAMGKRNRIRKSISRSSRAAVARDLNSPRALLSAVAANLTVEHDFIGSVGTFARADGNDFGVNGGLKVTF